MALPSVLTALLMLGCAKAAGAATTKVTTTKAATTKAANTKAAVLCPKDYCLTRIATGDGADSFQCEQHADPGYFCAEGLSGSSKCACNGFVKFGNYVRPNDANGTARPEKWSALKAVTGTVNCSKKNFGEGVVGSNWCWCFPKVAVPVTKSDIKPASNKTGEAPKCLIVTFRFKSPLITPAVMWALGANEGAVGLLVNVLFPTHFKTPSARILEFDKSTFQVKTQISCPLPQTCLGSPVKASAGVLALRADRTPFITIADGFVKKNAALLGALSKFGEAKVDYEFQPKTLPAPGGPTTTTVKGSVSGAKATFILFGTLIAVAVGARNSWLE